jgi:signal transduction histidine kinase/CheY-like chemotaxis protein
MHSSDLKQLQLIIDRLKEENRSLKAELDLHHKVEDQACFIQKMEALAAFSGRIAHDFNNILHLLLRGTELALTDKTEDSLDYQNLIEIKSNIQKGSEFTEQFMKLGSVIKPEFAPQNLNSIILATEKFLSQSIPATIDVQLTLADDLMSINANPDQCEQILLNLCLNARDAISENGEIRIQTQNIFRDDSQIQQALYLQQKDYVLLNVSDNGSGIPFQLLNHIYEPFFTTKENTKNKGLGLSMVYAIVKNHDGFIECASTEGEGTTFKIFLPALNADKQAIKKAESINRPGHRKKSKTVLIIDDETTILEIGQTILQRHGYKVFTARNGEEGMSLYSQFAVDLVLLDLGLPGIGGIRCLKKLLAFNDNAKIIIMSGDLSNGRVQEAMTMGAKAFLAKPFNLTQLLNAVEKVLGKSQEEKPA